MLKRITDGIWGHEQDFLLPGGVPMPARATLLRLPDGGLLLHSPLGIDEATAREIDALGEVKLLVAPSCMHCTFLQDAIRRYPSARVLGPARLNAKIRGLTLDALPATGRLTDGISVQRVDGAPRLGEHVFFHEASRTLLVSDLVFNIHHSPSWRMRLYLRLGRAHGRVGQSFFWRFLVRDRAATARSVSALLEWDFTRVVVAHGDVIEDDAHDRMREALSWMMSARALVARA